MNDVDKKLELIECNTLSGESALAIRYNRYLYRLTSLYNCSAQIDRWFTNYENCNPYSIFVMFGVANGIYLDKMLEYYDNAIFLIYEPLNEIYEKIENKYKDNKNVYITYGNNGKTDIYYLFNIFFSTSSYKYVKWIVLPNYDYLWEKDILDVYRQYAYILNTVVMDARTKAVYDKSAGIDYLKILSDLFNQYSEYDLENKMALFINKESVAIVVAAGPSLERNIEELKLVKNHAFIIAVDTALKPLYASGVKPDIVVSIDNGKPISFFDTPDFANMPFVLESGGNPRLVKIHKGKRFYATSGESYTSELLDLIGKKSGHILTGGSVGNSAFYLAVACGFKKIIMVGHDLAMTNGKIHAEGIHENKKDNIASENGTYRDVDGYYGGKVRTRGDYYAYLRWFELQIECHPELEVINSTEGGANIRGARNESLKKAIEEWCLELPYINYNSIINKVDKLCSEDDKDIIQEYLESLPEKMKKYKKKLKEGINEYNNLKKLKYEEKEGTEEFKNSFAKIKELNSWLSKIKENSLLDMYEADFQNSLDIGIYDFKDDTDEEWDSTINLGINSFKLYLKRIDDFLKDYKIIKGERK
nr:6-hydroxymethylpterin diphosphokinase MptE-like protein [uncultured Agathobacter sp.]